MFRQAFFISIEQGSICSDINSVGIINTYSIRTADLVETATPFSKASEASAKEEGWSSNNAWVNALRLQISKRTT